jgi:ABC-type multidrug transport system ATPase subunit
MTSTENPSHFVEILTPSSTGTDQTFLNSEPPKFTLEWTDLCLKVAVKNVETKTTDEKVILNGVSGVANPGELLVIMGPSGAGKSSLLDCIAGRNKQVEGVVAVNGQPWSKAISRHASYVMQDDLFYPTITVKEHLLFQARMRMGSDVSEEHRERRVQAVMEELGLVKCADTLIGGSDNVRGVSGGERKRLSFATEILTNPSILFVDEPTSGLDSFTTEAVVLQLLDIARSGRTVVATIHQPSSELFALFDKLYLLADGAPVYHGKASESVAYFASVGLQCPPFLNPADYFMKQLVVMNKQTDVEAVARVTKLKAEWATHQQHQHQQQLATGSKTTENQLEETDDHGTGLSVWEQGLVLTRRNFMRTFRDLRAVIAGLSQTLFMAVLLGLIYLQVDVTQGGVQNLVGALFYMPVNQIFAGANPTFVSVPLDLPIIQREYSAGLYRLASWYFAKNVSELPLQIVSPLLFFVPVYFLVGFGHGVTAFLYMLLAMFLLESCGVGLGYLVSCLSQKADVASIIGVATIMPFVLFGGLLINLDDTPAYFVWIQYLSPIKYAFSALMKIYWGRVDLIPCDADAVSCATMTGDQVLRSWGMGTGGDASAFTDMLVLLGLNVAFRLLAFLGLWNYLRKLQ